MVSLLILVAAPLIHVSAFLGSPGRATAPEKLPPPDIVLILADDLGYGDVHALNPDSAIPTPHLDQLARGGMAFADAHSPSSVCTPTRYGLLTGRYCWRTSLKSGVLNGYGSPLIAPGRETIAEFLRTQRYHTAIVGKWHLGLGFTPIEAAEEKNQFDYSQPVTDGPHTHGFDHSFVIPASLDFPPYLYVRNGKVTQLPTLEQPARKFPDFLRQGPRSPDLDIEKCLDDLCDEAVAYVEDQTQRKQRYFLYFPLTAPHKPVLPESRFRGKTAFGPYGDFVHQVDATVGRVLDAIERGGNKKNTIVIFTSDNGSFMYRLPADKEADHAKEPTVQGFYPQTHRANHNFRGTKADIWEAGHHVPFLVHWPAQVAAGSASADAICLTDVFATVVEITDGAVAPETAPDSFSFLAALRGQERETPRPAVIHHSAAGMFAIRHGPWKLVLGNGSGGREAPRGKPFERPYALFDLSADPAETENLVAKFPAVAAQLEAECQKIREQSGHRPH